mgnify:CR=1 FL=1
MLLNFVGFGQKNDSDCLFDLNSSNGLFESVYYNHFEELFPNDKMKKNGIKSFVIIVDNKNDISSIHIQSKSLYKYILNDEGFVIQYTSLNFQNFYERDRKGIILKEKRLTSLWIFYTKHSWKLGVLILFILIFGFLFRKIELNTNYEESYGKIYDVKRIVSVNRVGPLFKYKFWFTYEGEKYFGETTQTLKGNNKIGKIFKVKVSTNNPKNYKILFDQEYVKKYILDKNRNKKVFYFKKN